MTRTRWQTRFGSFVAQYGVNRLVEEIRSRGESVTPAAIYAYVAGRNVPRPPVMHCIAKISRGRVRLADMVFQSRETCVRSILTKEAS